MSKELPKFANDIPFALVNWNDRDSLVGRLMEVIEAVMPEGSQQTATKNLVKKVISEHFTHLFNDQFEALTRDYKFEGGMEKYIKAIWDLSQTK